MAKVNPKLIDELKSISEDVPPTGDEVTIASYVDAFGIPRSTAKSRLDDLVRAGVLVKRWGIKSGHRYRIYSRAPGIKPGDLVQGLRYNPNGSKAPEEER